MVSRPSWTKRILFCIVGFVAFLLLFVIALRIAVSEMSRGIESSRAMGLAAVPSWDLQSMWSSPPMFQKSVDADRSGSLWGSAVARTAALRSRSSSFDQSVEQLHRVVATHLGYLEDLRTESQSGSGRALAATLSVPAKEFDATIADLKSVGRTEAVSQAGEDSAVKLATAKRHFAAAQTNLERLQKLQRERRGELHDVVALEKDIAQANEVVAEAQREQEALLSTVAQAHISFTLMEDYRAPLQASFASSSLALRNSLVEGVSAIFSSLALVLGVLFEFGLPLVFWAIILFWPARVVWRRIRHTNTPVPADHAAS